jgi:hypothetical protein
VSQPVTIATLPSNANMFLPSVDAAAPFIALSGGQGEGG